MTFRPSREKLPLKGKKDGPDKPESYEKQMETYTMRNAVNFDYFRTLELDHVLTKVGHPPSPIDAFDSQMNLLDPKELGKQTLKKILFVNFSSSRLRTVGIINLCHNLTICDLSCNFLERIDGLSQCRHLKKLDAHHNQVR